MTYSKKNALVLALLTSAGTMLATGIALNRRRWNPAPTLLACSAVTAAAAAVTMLAKPTAKFTTEKLQTVLENVGPKPLQEFDQPDLDDLLSKQPKIAGTPQPAVERLFDVPTDTANEEEFV